jgi:hypothetical protein
LKFSPSGCVLMAREWGLAGFEPTITFREYGHLFNNTDGRAATIMEAAFAKV